MLIDLIYPFLPPYRVARITDGFDHRIRFHVRGIARNIMAGFAENQQLAVGGFQAVINPAHTACEVDDVIFVAIDN